MKLQNMSKSESLLLKFYGTIAQSVTSFGQSGLAIHQIPNGNGYVSYNQELLLEATQCILEDSRIENYYSLHALSSLIADRLVTIFATEPDDPKKRIAALLCEIADVEPETMNVIMPIQGMTISHTVKIGEFVFIPEKDYASLGLKMPSQNVDALLRNHMWKGPHVKVPVTACEPEKAREKARIEFQWLENTIRLFANRDFHDVGIISFSHASIEKALITSADGTLRGTSLNLQGARIPYDFEEVFPSGGALFLVVDKLGRNQNALTPIQKQIRHATYLGGLSIFESIPEISFFLCVSALEAIFLSKSDVYINPSIAQRILEAYCYLFVDEKMRRMTFEQMRFFYNKRSSFAHGGQKTVSNQEVKLVQSFLRNAILQLLFDSELSKIKSSDEISSLILDKKFGPMKSISSTHS